MASDFADEAAELLGRVRAEAPLVQSIINHVAMSFAANALIASGAAPAMVHAAEEAGEITRSRPGSCLSRCR